MAATRSSGGAPELVSPKATLMQASRPHYENADDETEFEAESLKSRHRHRRAGLVLDDGHATVSRAGE